MFIAQVGVDFAKLRRSGIFMPPLTGLGVKNNIGAINMKPLRGFANCL
jgi:hypothetical protein